MEGRDPILHQTPHDALMLTFIRCVLRAGHDFEYGAWIQYVVWPLCVWYDGSTLQVTLVNSDATVRGGNHCSPFTDEERESRSHVSRQDPFLGRLFSRSVFSARGKNSRIKNELEFPEPKPGRNDSRRMLMINI